MCAAVLSVVLCVPAFAADYQGTAPPYPECFDNNGLVTVPVQIYNGNIIAAQTFNNDYMLNPTTPIYTLCLAYTNGTYDIYQVWVNNVYGDDVTYGLNFDHSPNQGLGYPHVNMIPVNFGSSYFIYDKFRWSEGAEYISYIETSTTTDNIQFDYMVNSPALSSACTGYPNYSVVAGNVPIQSFLSDTGETYTEPLYNWWVAQSGKATIPDDEKDNEDEENNDINIDTDGDGSADTNIDTDDDGKPDTNIDTDGDGKPDTNIDTDSDGKPDTNIDTDSDGKADTNIDTDSDGKADTNIDTDGDGSADTNIDTDSDGSADTNIDTDGDGRADTNIDTDGDGKPDTNIDTDNDSSGDGNNTGNSGSSSGSFDDFLTEQYPSIGDGSDFKPDSSYKPNYKAWSWFDPFDFSHTSPSYTDPWNEYDPLAGYEIPDKMTQPDYNYTIGQGSYTVPSYTPPDTYDVPNYTAYLPG